ncbi:MAG: hypothetical protein CVU05_00305 [Bacteroidetes bacterium HGW-Bacteroidetes-21]|jgi:hypothetical protein|nr:MAG: hypothetical protein CVU05_00305 [Bacteroidetes bacterium HGW-Bacteroidetes-21]
MKKRNNHIVFSFSFKALAVCLFSVLIILPSCKKEEEKIIKNYYSVGILSNEVLSYTNLKSVVKVRFFVLDKSNADGLVRFDINGRISLSGDYSGAIDSLKRITTPEKGNYSAAILMSNGLDVTINMNGIFDRMEPTVRKIIHGSLPSNEILLAKVGDKQMPIELLSNGFISNPGETDQIISQFFHTGNTEAFDTLRLLTAIDSMLDYLNAKSTYENQHLFIFMTRRKNYWQEINLYSLMNKALQSKVICHFLEFTEPYTWSNNNIHGFLERLNAGTQGIYYKPPYSFDYNYDDGELPMDFLQISGKIPEMMQGGFDCFEVVMTLESPSPEFYNGCSYTSGLRIMLNTDFEQETVEVPFNFFIK